MGSLSYGPAATSITIDDRDLAHLQAVMLAKLRRGESFAFSLDRASEVGAHSTIWVHPSASLEFAFSGPRPPALNRVWIDALMKRANSNAGLELVSEADAEHAAGHVVVAPQAEPSPKRAMVRAP